MMLYNWLILLVIILGWGVIWIITNCAHKNNDRVNLINKKNDMLRDLQPKAIMCWNENFNDTEKYDEVFALITQIITIYDDLRNDHNDVVPHALSELRSTLTLNIESKEKFDPKELSNRRRDIQRVITDLRGRPPKFNKILKFL